MQKQKINQNWLFYKDGCPNAARVIDLPHDAMLDEPRDPNLPNGTATGFFPGGRYIYEKTFAPGVLDSDGANILEFEGVYMDSTVILNGENAGGRVFGYTDFFVDITRKVLPGENKLTVIADNSRTPNSRWYSGSGIYRSVNLWTGGAAHIEPDSVRVKTLSVDPAVISVRAETKGELCHEVLFNGEVIATASGQEAVLAIPDAKLWSDGSPALYSLRTVLKEGERELDTNVTTFGIRTLSWDAKKGFQVNGNTVKLRGGCVHHDHGILGARSYIQSEYRRVKTLKSFGFNAIRYSHNPAGKDFLQACDELGMYVIDESFDQWKIPQSEFDYALHFDAEWQKDVRALIKKDYNHPCVVMYCIGNEITDTGLPFGAQVTKAVSGLFRQTDDTRPTMLAINSMLSTLAAMQAKKQAEEGQKPKQEKQVGSKEANDIVALLPSIMKSITPESLEALVGECLQAVDIAGYNYSGSLCEGTHLLSPDRVMLLSETFPQSLAEDWATVEQHDYIVGCFHWAAWDYLGESGVGLPVYGTSNVPFSKKYPCQTAACGSIDLTGYPESAAYYAATLWGANCTPYIGVRPLTHAGEEYALGKWRLTDTIPCWTWSGCEGKTAEIEVFSAGDSVELLQDGITLGKKPLVDCRAAFCATYSPGSLVAISRRGGIELARSTLVTAGSETVLRIVPECESVKADAGSVIYVPVHLTDAQGILKMAEDRTIHITVSGPGKLMAFGSGRPETEECYMTGTFTSWHGRALAAIVCSGVTGTINVTAEACGMAAVSTGIRAY